MARGVRRWGPQAAAARTQQTRDTGAPECWTHRGTRTRQGPVDRKPQWTLEAVSPLAFVPYIT